MKFLSASTCTALAFAAALLCDPLLDAARAGVVIDQGQIVLTLGAGDQAKRVIQVSNTGDKPLAVTVFASDWQQNAQGAVDAVAPGSVPRSATRWIGVNPSKFTVPAGGKQEVSVSIAIPADANLTGGDYYSMIFTETEDAGKATDPSTGRDVKLRIIGRLGTKIFVRPAGLALSPAAEITGMQVAKQQGETVLTVALENTGNAYFRCETSFINVQDAKGEKLPKVSIPAFSCLPGNKRTINVPIPLKTGAKYTLLAVIDYGAAEVLAGELELVAP